MTGKTGILALGVLLFLYFALIPCLATDPAWILKEENRKIGDLAISPDGSAVIAGTGKVLLLSKDGAVVANEPYGERLIQSRDGSSIIATYSSPVASTVYMFRKKTDAAGNPILQKMWETSQPYKVTSFAVSDKGDRIACSAGGKNVFVLEGNTGNLLGNSENHTSAIAISGKGSTIAAISREQGLITYSTRGRFSKDYEISLPGTPKTLLMDTDGHHVVFDAGLNIIAVNISDGHEKWRTKTKSEVNALAMTPAGDMIVTGTTNGTIDLYDADGNQNWTYYSNTGTGSGQAIVAVALTKDASGIIAGSADGKVMLLDSTGTLQWIFQTKNDPVTRVAIAADGSLAAATSDSTIYAFTAGGTSSTITSLETTAGTPYPTISSGITHPTESRISSITRDTTVAVVSTPRTVERETPAVTITEYSVIKKSTESPQNGIISLAGLLIAIILVSRKR